MAIASSPESRTTIRGSSAPRRRLSDAPVGIADSDRERLERAKHQAENLGELATAATLQNLASKSFGSLLDPAAYQTYRDQFLRDAGDPSDPVEQLLLEELVLAHHHIGRLHVRASEATSAEVAKVFYAALARLQGEARRLTLAIRLYRTPVETKRFTVVKQQNIATAQQVTLMDDCHSKTSQIPKSADNTQLTSNAQPQGGDRACHRKVRGRTQNGSRPAGSIVPSAAR